MNFSIAPNADRSTIHGYVKLLMQKRAAVVFYPHRTIMPTTWSELFSSLLAFIGHFYVKFVRHD